MTARNVERAEKPIARTVRYRKTRASPKSSKQTTSNPNNCSRMARCGTLIRNFAIHLFKRATAHPYNPIYLMRASQI